MSFILGFFVGLLVGAVVFYFVYKNNKEKIDLVAKAVEIELADSEKIEKIKAIFK